jgi:hypothetical protein
MKLFSYETFMRVNRNAAERSSTLPLISTSATEAVVLLEAASMATGSEDIKRFGAPTPQGQKHTVWNRTGNLLSARRSDLTTEPRLQTRHMKCETLRFMKLNCKKKINAENMLESHVVLFTNSGIELHNEGMSWGY